MLEIMECSILAHCNIIIFFFQLLAKRSYFQYISKVWISGFGSSNPGKTCVFNDKSYQSGGASIALLLNRLATPWQSGFELLPFKSPFWSLPGIIKYYSCNSHTQKDFHQFNFSLYLENVHFFVTYFYCMHDKIFVIFNYQPKSEQLPYHLHDFNKYIMYTCVLNNLLKGSISIAF